MSETWSQIKSRLAGGFLFIAMSIIFFLQDLNKFLIRDNRDKV
jgi:hypothetical protein